MINQLVWKKEMQMIDFCLDKQKEIQAKYKNTWFISCTRPGLQHDYYTAVACRLLYTANDMLTEENKCKK